MPSNNHNQTPIRLRSNYKVAVFNKRLFLFGAAIQKTRVRVRQPGTDQLSPYHRFFDMIAAFRLEDMKWENIALRGDGETQQQQHGQGFQVQH